MEYKFAKKAFKIGDKFSNLKNEPCVLDLKGNILQGKLRIVTKIQEVKEMTPIGLWKTALCFFDQYGEVTKHTDISFPDVSIKTNSRIILKSRKDGKNENI